jgi:hypothetical protein
LRGSSLLRTQQPDLLPERLDLGQSVQSRAGQQPARRLRSGVLSLDFHGTGKG